MANVKRASATSKRDNERRVAAALVAVDAMYRAPRTVERAADLRVHVAALRAQPITDDEVRHGVIWALVAAGARVATQDPGFPTDATKEASMALWYVKELLERAGRDVAVLDDELRKLALRAVEASASPPKRGRPRSGETVITRAAATHDVLVRLGVASGGPKATMRAMESREAVERATAAAMELAKLPTE